MEEQYDEIDIIELAGKFFREWRLILKWCCWAAIVGIVVAVSLPREYKASSTMAPETSSSAPSLGSYSSLASVLGVNLSFGSSSADAISPVLYPEVVSFNPFVAGLFSLPVSLEKKGSEISMDLYEYAGLHTKFPWWKTLLELPSKAIRGVIGLFRKGERKEGLEGYADLDVNHLTGEQMMVIGRIRKNISISQDKKNGLIKVEVAAQNPDVAADLNRAVVSRLQEYVTEYRTEKFRRDLAYYEELCEQAEKDYLEASKKYAGFVDSNQNIVSQKAKVEEERLMNESQLAFQVFTQCSMQVQTAKAKLQQETPVFTVLEPASLPLRPCNKPVLFYIFIFGFFGFLLSALWIFFFRGIFEK